MSLPVNIWTNDGGATEIISGLPPIRKAFFCGVENGRARVTNFGDFIGTGDLTFLVTVRISASGGSAFRNYLGFNTYQVARTTNVNNTLGINVDGSTFLQDRSDLLTVVITRDSTTGFITYGRDYQETQTIVTPIDLTGELLNIQEGINPNCHFVRVGIWSRVLSEREIASLDNNSFSSNPDLTILEKCEGYYLADAFVNGSVLSLRDYSGNNRHADMTLVSGATAADKLITYQNNLVDIDTLR